MKVIKIVFSLIVIIITFNNCRKMDLKEDVPGCIKRKIRLIQLEKVRNPPARVYEWNVEGKKYYHISSDCCDQYNYLYDDNCNEICAPDGGSSGGGDGKCPEFNGQVITTLIWKDDRK